ncbi:endoplasmic reticulum membrane sensor NFE2L1-like [Hippoglossus hippoglossus]|uniref:endoplasmic reticulum membrane sensor NFE2L1-like n=1 Tax=Hippoglossus hippoglossus TaxID=8267 RepID=UPI00148CC982|nr:endoplasmic reticulum membrane sensor NFE2L1-like [Hippoglossus hippoglossus]XP_034450175.1 endoplasmic reticulum membrane sensor NFE2L1-like [Hippoglossus hippoglossus]
MTMLCLKKYFTEGLIQVAILLSLCGVRVDVGLEPYLPPSLQSMMGQTSALTQTQFHNLRNHLEDGHGLHPKNVDLDGFFTTRRLLGWVRSLDRLQIPHAELETWLVQREPDPLPIERPDQSSLLERAPARLERDLIGLTVEPRPGLGTLQEEVEAEEKEEEIHNELHYSDDLDESGEEEEDEEEDMARMHSHYMRTLGGGRTERSDSRANNRELTHNEAEQTSFPLQECLRLLEETFPFTEEQQLSDVGRRGGDLGRHHSGREPLLSPIIPTDNPTLDLELDWQDLFAIMEPENTDVDTMRSFDNVLESRPPVTPPVESETLNLNCNNLDNGIADAHQDAHLVEIPLQHGFLWPASQPQLEPALLPLTPSAELDDHTSAFNTWDISKNSNVNTLHRPPDHMDLLAEEPSEDFSMGQNADDNSSTFNINLLAQDPVDNLEESPCVEYAPYPGDLASFNVNLNSRHLTAPSPSLSPDRNDMTQNLLISPSSVFLVDEEDVGDEDLPGQISDLLEDAAILDEMRLLDLALEEGFSPEMAARLEEEGYLDSEIAKHDTDRDGDHSSTAVTEDQSEPGRHQQDGDDEADTDSGLSLDFSYSPASPFDSESSYYSSSSSSASNSSLSSISDVESPFYEDKEEDAEEGLLASDMEVEVTIKQEELDEEEMGAVGGYPEDIKKLLPVNYGDHKLLNGFTWLEQIDHDHTYNQPLPSASSPSRNIPTKHTKSSPQHPNHYHYSSSRHISETKMRSRDERRARGLKIPFSSELIINLPVEEFNDLLTNYKLNEEQLSLIRDIRRRGKNKIAAQNCRKRKLSVLLGLEDNVSGLRRRRSRLLREKQDTLRNLQEMKRRLGTLYQEVFSRLRDGEGRPLDSAEYSLNFGPNGSVMVASHQQEGLVPLTGEKTSKKQRNKKK